MQEKKEISIVFDSGYGVYSLMPLAGTSEALELAERYPVQNTAAYSPIEGIRATRISSSLFTDLNEGWLRRGPEDNLVIDQSRNAELLGRPTIWQMFHHAETTTIVMSEPLLLERSEDDQRMLHYPDAAEQFVVDQEALIRQREEQRPFPAHYGERHLLPKGTILEVVDCSRHGGKNEEVFSELVSENPNAVVIYESSHTLALVIRLPSEKSRVEIPRTSFT